MFSLADFEKGSINLNFIDQNCICNIRKNYLTETYLSTVNFGVGGFIETYDVVPPYLILQSWNGRAIRAKIMLLGITLNSDNEFKFDLQIGIPFEVAIGLLYKRHTGEGHD